MLYAVFDRFTGDWVANVDDLNQIDPLYYSYQVLPDVSAGAATPDEEVKYDPTTQMFSYDYTNLQNILKVQVNDHLEAAQVTTITEGFGKAQEYAGKQAEVTLYDLMDTSRFLGMSDAELQEKFTYAYQDALYLGGNITDAIERFREGIRTSRYLLAQQAAIASAVKQQIILESTADAKRQAYLDYIAQTGTVPNGGILPGNPNGSTLYLTTETGEALTNEQNIAILV